MDCFIISAHTKVTELEIKELLNKPCEVFEQVCVVKDLSIKELAILSYHAQSATRVCLLIGQGPDKDHVQFKELNMLKEKSFGVEHIKILEDPYPSTDFASEIGGQIQDLTDSPVNLSSPQVKIISCNDSQVFVGIDLIGFDMAKRPYKLMAYPGSINGSFAYCLLRLAGVKNTSKVVDPFCGSATIPIETALFQRRISPFKLGKKLLGVTLFGEEFAPLDEVERKVSIQGFDHQVKVMLTGQKNAKIASVLDHVTISKVAIDWVDAKFEEHDVDIIVTNPPKVNKRTNNRKQIEKIYDDLFYQAKYVLKKKGIVAMLLNKDEVAVEMASKHSFSVKETMELFSGKQGYAYVIFQAP